MPAASIHHYRRQGLLPEPGRAASNRFVYDQRHVEALTVLRRLRERRGLSLAQIRDILPRMLADHEDQAFRAEMWHDAVDSLLLGPETAPDAASKLVDVAIEAFGEAGFSEVSVADLCDRAGIAKGSFYRHFDTKDDLFLAAAHTVVDRAAAAFAEQVAEPLDLAEAFAEHLHQRVRTELWGYAQDERLDNAALKLPSTKTNSSAFASVML